MTPEQAHFLRLLNNYKSFTLNEAELAEFYAMVTQPQYLPLLQEAFDKDLSEKQVTHFYSIQQSEASYYQVWEAINYIHAGEEKDKAPASSPVPRIGFLKRYRIGYAAAAILVLSLFTYFIFTAKQSTPSLVKNNFPAQTDPLPAEQKATLTLADGQVITLDSTAGNVVKRGNTIVYNQNGSLYVDAKDTEAGYNTLTTPRGGQYKVKLPDNTDAWLNAGSSITYPTAFAGKERKVKITGEVYFEVTKNAHQPFVVDINGKSSVKVLGTHFNINSYADEGTIKTTLLEGLVTVISGKQSVRLSPGQQASAGEDGADEQQQLRVIDDIDVVEEAMAWRNGFFQFSNVELELVMRQLARWYDVDVIYEASAPPHKKIVGQIRRDAKLSAVLKALSYTGIHFRVEGRQVIVQAQKK